MLNKAVFKVKFKFKVENYVLQIFVHQFLGWNIWQNSTHPFFSYILQRNWKKKIKIYSFWPWQIHLEYLGAIKMRDKDDISIWNIWMWIKWETKFLNSYGLLSIGVGGYPLDAYKWIGMGWDGMFGWTDHWSSLVIGLLRAPSVVISQAKQFVLHSRLSLFWPTASNP